MLTPPVFSIVKDFSGREVVANSVTTNSLEIIGGSATSSSTTLHKFDLDVLDAGITTGIPLMTPKVGDVILDVWTVTTQSFNNGSNLFWDVGTYNPLADDPTRGFCLYFYSANPRAQFVQNTLQVDYKQNYAYPNSLSSVAIRYAIQNAGQMYPWQITMTKEVPLKFIMTQTGVAGGAAVAATAGKFSVYVLVSTPTA